MAKWWLLSLLALAPLAASAQSACEARCNQQASACLKACTGDPKDASKPEAAQQMMSCLSRCQKEAEPCRQQCRPPPPPPPQDR